MAIKEAAEKASVLETQNRGMERSFRIAQEISQLIVYCRSVTFNIDRLRQSFIYYEMSSFHETRAERLICNQETKFFLKYHQVSNSEYVKQ